MRYPTETRLALLFVFLVFFASCGSSDLADENESKQELHHLDVPTTCLLDNGREVQFYFERLNATLNDTPELVELTGLESVTTCEQAIHFSKSQLKFEEQNMVETGPTRVKSTK